MISDLVSLSMDRGSQLSYLVFLFVHELVGDRWCCCDFILGLCLSSLSFLSLVRYYSSGKVLLHVSRAKSSRSYPGPSYLQHFPSTRNIIIYSITNSTQNPSN